MFYSKFLMIFVVCVAFSSTLVADTLKEDMQELRKTVTLLGTGFFYNNKQITLDAAQRLQSQVKEYLGDKKAVEDILGDNMKYKSSIALNSTEMIIKYAKEIEHILNDENSRLVDRQVRTQKAFLAIQNECMRCHNLTRDWE